jgi:hypothetical protein
LKADDPRLEESLKRLTERIKKLDDTILTVLKNHVAVEQFMGAFLAIISSTPCSYSSINRLCRRVTCEQHPTKNRMPAR